MLDPGRFVGVGVGVGRALDAVGGGDVEYGRKSNEVDGAAEGTRARVVGTTRETACAAARVRL